MFLNMFPLYCIFALNFFALSNAFDKKIYLDQRLFYKHQKGRFLLTILSIKELQNCVKLKLREREREREKEKEKEKEGKREKGREREKRNIIIPVLKNRNRKK